MNSKAKNEGHDTSKREEYMTQPPLVFLRELMGDAWIDANAFGENPKHLLGQWWKKGDQTSSVDSGVVFV